VVVAGAGLAGLHAALTLEDAGLSVLVLEGRARVGGKILTFANVPGLPEAGGQSIGSGYGRVVDAANRSGVVLEDQLPQALPPSGHRAGAGRPGHPEGRLERCAGATPSPARCAN